MKKVIFILLLLILISGCATFKKRPDTTPDILRCRSFGPARGIVVDFVENAPPKEIREERKFTVSLKFANFNKNAMDVEYYVEDNTDASGFENQLGSVGIEPAAIEEKDGILRLYEPGCNIFGEDLPEKNLGIFVYNNLEVDKELEFIARIDYDYISLANGYFCVYDVNRQGSSVPCSMTEVLSGENALGLGTRYDPVAVTRVEKTLVGFGNYILVNLNIFIQNLIENGIVDTENGEIVDFTMIPDGELNFDCGSDNIVPGSKRGNSLRVYLKDRKAIVNCQSEVNTDRLVKYGFNVELRYPYEYYARTGPISTKKSRE